jgi:hypothetical protein
MQLRSTPQFRIIDDESCFDLSRETANAMKRPIQHSSYQRALQPLRQPVTFDISDGDPPEGIQAQSYGLLTQIQELEQTR